MGNTTSSIRKPKLDMGRVDGNVFAIIGAVSRKLKDAGMRDRAEEFKAKAMKQHSYDDVLRLCFDYVDVTYSTPDEDDDERCGECGEEPGYCQC